MDMTIKMLAETLGVSKFTISKAIDTLSIIPRKVGNRFVLSDEQVQLLSAHILHSSEETPETKDSPLKKTRESHETVAQETIETKDLQESQIEKPKESRDKTIEALESLIKTLELHNVTLQEQLKVKDEQIVMQAQQLTSVTAALQSAQEQQAALTAALTAAQALHAGTIQERLSEQSSISGESDGAVVQENQSATSEPSEKKRGIFTRLFGKK
jgi:hypothetical protein